MVADGTDEVKSAAAGRELLEEKVGHVWTVHLHNQWSKPFPSSGWIERLLEGYKRQVGMIEDYARAAGDAVGKRILVRKVLPTPSAEELMSGPDDVVEETKVEPRSVGRTKKAGATAQGKAGEGVKVDEQRETLPSVKVKTDEDVKRLVDTVLTEEAARHRLKSSQPARLR